MFDLDFDQTPENLKRKLATLERVKRKLEDGESYPLFSLEVQERMIEKLEKIITEVYCQIGEERGFLADTTR